MVTILLTPIIYKSKEQIGIYFPKDAGVNMLIKKIKGIKWSQQHTCWYLPLSREYYTTIVTMVGNTATIDTSKLKAYLQKRQQVSSGRPAAGEKMKKNDNPSPILPPAKIWSLPAENVEALKQLHINLTLKAYSPSTIRTYYNEMVQLLLVLKNKPVNSLTPEELKRYMQYAITKLKISENTAHSRLNALKFYFEQVLGREKFFWEIPRPKKPVKLPKILSEEKIIEGLIAVKNIKHKTILLLAYSAGLRVSEVVKLKLTDINSDRMQISIEGAKGKKDRMVTLSKSILILLREYYVLYKPSHWLFEGQHKEEHYSTRAAQLIFKAACRSLHLPPQCSFHSLRHSYATHLLDNGTDIAFIQKLLGHTDIKTTFRYIHVSNKDIGKIESPLDKLMRKNTT